MSVAVSALVRRGSVHVSLMAVRSVIDDADLKPVVLVDVIWNFGLAPVTSWPGLSTTVNLPLYNLSLSGLCVSSGAEVVGTLLTPSGG